MQEPGRLREAAETGKPERALGRELGIMLAVKLVALGVLWLLFFRAPAPADPARLLAPGASSPQGSAR